MKYLILCCLLVGTVHAADSIKWVDKPSSVIASVTRNASDKWVMRFNDNSGRAIVTIDQLGRVTINGTPDEAARAFWHAVELMAPRCTP